MALTKEQKRAIKRMKGKHVMAAWAEAPAGPGWSNELIWVLLRDGDGKLSVDAFQPAEQSHDMYVLFSASRAVSSSMKLRVMQQLGE